MDRTVNVAFRSKVDDSSRPVFNQQLINEFLVSNISEDKNMPVAINR